MGNSKWHEITNQQELDDFLWYITYFHDSVLKELRYTSGSYSNTRGAYVIDDLKTLSVIFQGVWLDGHNTALELEFGGLEYMNLVPIPPEYTSEIFGASMAYKDGRFYWCDQDEVKEQDIEKCEATLICAERLRWRECEELLGEEQVFVHGRGAPEETPEDTAPPRTQKWLRGLAVWKTEDE